MDLKGWVITVCGLGIFGIMLFVVFLAPTKDPTASAIAGSELCFPIKDYLDRNIGHSVEMEATRLDLIMKGIEQNLDSIEEYAKTVFEHPESFPSFAQRQYQSDGKHVFSDEGLGLYYLSSGALPEEVKQQAALTEYLEPLVEHFYVNNQYVSHVELLFTSGLIRAFPPAAKTEIESKLKELKSDQIPDVRLSIASGEITPERKLTPVEDKALHQKVHEGVWTLPHQDVQGNLEISFVIPLEARAKHLGVASADIDLAYLQELLMPVKTTPNAYAFLLTHGGEIIMPPVQAIRDFNLSEGQLVNFSTTLVPDILHKSKSIDVVELSGITKAIAWQVIPASNWVYVLVVPIDELNPHKLLTSITSTIT